MGRYLREAKHHAERIDYYHEYAGPLGYQQAEYHFHRLQGLVGRAGRSKNDKSDVAPILALRDAARAKMEKMAQSRDDWASRSKGQSPGG